jgi:amino acid adenylation domain-containing protein
LAYMLEDSAPVALLTQSALVDAVSGRLPAGESLPVVVLDGDAGAALGAQPTHDPDAQALGLHARHLAYVIYTSGSTGRPKGVMVEHRNVLHLVINNPYASMTPADCIGHCANPAFDASTWEIWSGLLVGARVLVVPQSLLLDPIALNRALVDAGVTALFLTVRLFNEYATTLSEAFAGLDYLFVGGEVLDPRRIATVLESDSPPRRLKNMYGPTETTTYATASTIRSLPEGGRSIPIGRPIGNTRIYVLGPHGEPVPVGVTGEIYIGGEGVARGYLNRPELTAERFLPDPFSAVPGARVYRSGDLGRWLAHGEVEFLGRNDFQVKIRGFRIELGEIETRLAGCAGVREAIVVALGDAADGKRLVAYVIPEQADTPLSAADLRGQLMSELPDYMIPAAFVSMEAWPLTPNGKLDRRALPAPDASAVASRGYEAPIGEVEHAIASIWQELLGLERVGRHDRFFELGGHSLLAVQVVVRVQEMFNIKISLMDMFESNSIVDLAKLVASAQLDLYSQEEVDRLTAEIDDLSDEELIRIWQAENQVERIEQ